MSLRRKHEIPLLYGEPSDQSITNPEKWAKHLRETGQLGVSRLPKYCILSFPYMDVERHLKESGEVKDLRALGEKTRWYSFTYKGMPTCFADIRTGAPVAGANLEESYSLGVEYSVFFGGVGVLDSKLTRWSLLVPNKAIRDEGTSYHYEKPSVFSMPSPKLLQSIRDALRRRGSKFTEGAVWTTDGVYRETARKRDEFVRKGAICLDMEASALFSIAKFRRKHVAAIFYAGDLVGENKWDLRVRKDHEERKRETTKTLLNASLEALRSIWLEDVREE